MHEHHPPTPRAASMLAGLLPAAGGAALAVAGGVLGSGCGCHPALLHGMAAGGLLLAGAGAHRCWNALQQADAAWRSDDSRTSRQARFLALGSTIVAVVLLGFVVLAWLSSWLLQPCG